MAKPVKPRPKKPDNMRRYKKGEKVYFDISWSSLGSTAPKQLWKIKSKPFNTSSITEIKSVKHWETPQAKQQLSLLSGEINFTQHHINCHHTFVLRSANEVVHKESRIGLSVNDMTDALVNMNTMQSLYSNLIWSLKIKYSSVLRLVWAETWLPPDTHHMLLYSHHVVWPW